MADAKTKELPADAMPADVVKLADEAANAIAAEKPLGYRRALIIARAILADRAARAAPQPADAPHDVVRERIVDAAAELLECAQLRGDNDLPHPCDDPKLWTARMIEAWAEIEDALAAREALATSTEEALRAENARLQSNCCIEDSSEPCGPFLSLQEDLEDAQAHGARLREALEAFRTAKASLGADDYDGVDDHARDLLEDADSLALSALSR